MKAFLLTVLMLGLLSCSYEYMGMREQTVYRRDRQSDLYRNQAKQMREKNEYYSQDTLKGIYIQPVAVKNKGDIGVYAFSSYASHFGRVKFFRYKDNELILLDRNNLDSLQVAIENFLDANNFSKREIRTTKERVKYMWNIQSTDVF